MSVPQPKLHSALTADEAREAIILDFTNALRSKLIAVGLEGQHTTFVNAEWVGGVRVKAFLRKPTDVKVVGSLGEQGESDEQLEVPASVERQVKNPETVREELKGGRGEVGELLAVGELAEFTIEEEEIADTPQSENPFPLTDVVEARERGQDDDFERLHAALKEEGEKPFAGGATIEAPFILSSGEPPKLPEAEQEGGSTYGEQVRGKHPTLNSQPEYVNEENAPEKVLASSLCRFCSKPLPESKVGVRNHMRLHENKGEAIKFIDGDGAEAWRPNE